MCLPEALTCCDHGSGHHVVPLHLDVFAAGLTVHVQ